MNRRYWPSLEVTRKNTQQSKQHVGTFVCVVTLADVLIFLALYNEMVYG